MLTDSLKGQISCPAKLLSRISSPSPQKYSFCFNMLRLVWMLCLAFFGYWPLKVLTLENGGKFQIGVSPNRGARFLELAARPRQGRQHGKNYLHLFALKCNFKNSSRFLDHGRFFELCRVLKVWFVQTLLCCNMN